MRTLISDSRNDYNPRMRRRTAQLEAVFPSDVAIRQAKWEFGQAFQRAKRAGASLQAIGDAFGLTREAIRKNIIRYDRETSPVEAYLGQER